MALGRSVYAYSSKDEAFKKILAPIAKVGLYDSEYAVRYQTVCELVNGTNLATFRGWTNEHTFEKEQRKAVAYWRRLAGIGSFQFPI